ncbi:MAG TPA: site-specific integrase [Acidimicrobiales bacterium]|nr:site-specific integrase [Acidimicrobiales bacterium]
MTTATTQPDRPKRRAHGTGSLKEVSRGHWRLRVRDPVTSRQVYKTVIATGMREANRALADFDAEVRAGTFKPARARKAEARALAELPEAAAERTLAQLLAEWLAHRQNLGLSPTTLRGYQRMAKRIQADPAASKALSDLEPFDLDALYGRLTAEGKGPRTVKHHHGVVSSALGQARKWRWVRENVAELATVPKVPKPDLQPPSIEHLGALVASISARSPDLGSLTLFAFLTGCRRGELCGLRWEDVDWDAHSLRVARSVWELGGKTGLKTTKSERVRTIPLDDLAMTLLQTRWDQAMDRAMHARLPLPTDPALEGALTLPSSWYIWSSRVSGDSWRTPDSVSRGFARACHELDAAALKGAIDQKFDFRFHDLRHMCATQMVAMGVDVVTGSARLGHSVPSTFTNMYAHGLSQAARQAADGLGQLARVALPQAASNP